MATKICHWRHFAIRDLDGFRYFSLLCQGFTRRLERFVLDSGFVCFCQRCRKKFYTRELRKAIVLLPTGESDGDYHIKNTLQHLYSIANQWFNVFYDGLNGRQSNTRPPSVLDGNFARQHWFFDYIHLYFSHSSQGKQLGGTDGNFEFPRRFADSNYLNSTLKKRVETSRNDRLE